MRKDTPSNSRTWLLTEPLFGSSQKTHFCLTFYKKKDNVKQTHGHMTETICNVNCFIQIER